jgi:hypothetical protein
MYMKEPQNFSNWSEDDFNPSNRPRNTSVEWWNENYVAPARRYRESYSRKTQEEKEQDWRSYPDPLLNPGCTDYWFGGAQDPNWIKVEEKETEEEAESEISYSFPLDEGDSDYPDLTGIDLMRETAPSAGIRLELSEERNKLMFGDSVYEYWKEIQEWYSQSTPVDTSWSRWMPLPDSLLSTYLQGPRLSYLEAAQAQQEYEKQRRVKIEELQQQIEWEKLISPPSDESYFYGHGTRLTPAEEELNRLLYGDQRALRGLRSSPAPVSELTVTSKFEAIKALEQYFWDEGAPGDKIDRLLRVWQGGFIPTVEEMNQVKEGDLFSLFFSGEPDVRRDIRQRYMTDDEYALELLREYVASYKSSYVKDIELYLQQVADWKKLTDNAPLPVGHTWFLGNPDRIERPFLYDFNQQGPLLNYVPPEKGAFDVASVSGLGLPLTGYGAGFVGMPSGGEVTTTSGEDTTTASSLSMPSFPSVGLPSLAGGPSELPSPIGLGGVAGGVPSTPSVGLPSMGWDGAAMPASSVVPAGWDGAQMPAPSFSPSGMGGRSVAALPSPRSLGGGVTGGAFPSGGGMPDLGGGAGMGGSIAGGVRRGGGSSFSMPSFSFPSLNLGGLSDRGGTLMAGPSNVPDMSGMQSMANDSQQRLSRMEQLANRLFRIPEIMQTSLSDIGQNIGQGFMGGAMQGQRPQIVYRFEKGSVQVHSKKSDSNQLGNKFMSFFSQFSNQNTQVS